MKLEKLISTTDFVLWLTESYENKEAYEPMYDTIYYYAQIMKQPLQQCMFSGENKWFNLSFELDESSYNNDVLVEDILTWGGKVTCGVTDEFLEEIVL